MTATINAALAGNCHAPYIECSKTQINYAYFEMKRFIHVNGGQELTRYGNLKHRNKTYHFTVHIQYGQFFIPFDSMSRPTIA